MVTQAAPRALHDDNATSRQIHVVYVAPWIDIGGTDQATLDWLRFVDRSRVSVSLVTTQESPNRQLKNAWDGVTEIWNLAELVPAAHRPRVLRDLVARLDADVVHVMNSRLGFDLAPAFKQLDRPPVVVAQMHAEEGAGAGYPRYVADLYCDCVDVFAPSTAELARRLTEYGVPDRKIHMIPTGIDATRFTPREHTSDAGPLRVMFPARLAPEKDPRLFVDAMLELCHRGVDFVATMYGGPLESEVRTWATDETLDERLIVKGTISDLTDEYGHHDIAVLTSRSEGLPLALMEAMASELPVVAPTIDGIPELVDETVGVLFSQRSAAAVADAVCSLAVNAPRRRALGQQGRRRVLSTHSAAASAAGFHELYLQLAEDRY